MAKLPNLIETQLETPRPGRNIVSYQPSSVGEALEGVGRTISQVAAIEREKQDQLEMAYAKTDFLTGKITAEQEAIKDDKYEEYRPRYEKLSDEAAKRAASLIRNPQKRAIFEAESKFQIAQGLPSINKQAEIRRNDVGVSRLDEQLVALSNAYQATKDPALKEQIMRNAGAIIDASKQFMGDNREQQASLLKRKMVEDNAALSWAARPDAEKLDILKKASADKQPLSVRNNNPGNLRDSKTGEFRVFDTPETGSKAMEDDLRVKITGKSQAMKAKFGKNYSPTIENVITIWAPPTENDTAAYIKTVSDETGIAPDTPLTEADISKIMPVMTKVEGGGEATGVFGKTGTEFDFLSLADRVKLMNPEQKKKIAQGIADNEMAKDPSAFIKALDAGEYDGYLDANEKQKNKETALKIFDGKREQEQMTRIANAATNNKTLYDKFLANDPKILDEIAAYRESGGDAELANYMRDAVLKANPISAEEKAEIYAELNDEMNTLRAQKPEDTDIADLFRFQKRIIQESSRGVTGLNWMLKAVSPAILEMSSRERGSDDIGWKLFGEATEPYDAGYQVIQDWLEKQGKEDDIILKANMLSKFVDAVEAIPENTKKDQGLFDTELAKVANNVLSSVAKQGMPNIPLPAIQYLRDHPNTVEDFDALYGAGSAKRILGR